MRRSRRRLCLLARSEHGMALPTALFAMIASFALASVAVLSSVDSQRGTARDSASKNAIAAADAGAGVALLRLNRYSTKFSSLTPCIGPAGELQSATEGWCPVTPPESERPETVGGATFRYMVSAFQPNSGISVVAVGAAGGVSRRVNVKLARKNGEEVFKVEQLIGERGINLKGGVVVETNIGTNGGVELTSENGKSATICGNIRHGPGQPSPTPSPSPPCPAQGTVTEGTKTLPPVVPPADIATNNSNYRLAACVPLGTENGNPTGCETDKYEGGRTTTQPWDAAHRFIDIPNHATLRLGGGDYWVCRLSINGNLVMAENAQVRIFFDTPEHCSGLPSGNTQVEVTANGTITSSSFANCENNAEDCRVPGLYVMGSPTIPTSVYLSGNSGSTNELMVYAPYSNLEMGGNMTWIGMFAGKTLTMGGNPTIKSDLRIPQPKVYFPGLMERVRYMECTGATGRPPDVNC